MGGHGHVGEGGICVNVATNGYEDGRGIGKVQKLVEPYVMEEVVKRGGSVNGETGIGFAKAQYVLLGKSDDHIDSMLAIKNALDPNGILSPYKVFPHGRKMIWKSL